jgi:hypothetical protein
VRALVPIGLSALLLLAAPAAASADVIFDPADADDLAATLAEATADQDVCYGWDVQVDDAIAGQSESVGSDKGAGTPVDTSSCAKYVRLDVFITYTSESSESEDSASWDVSSTTGGPTRSDMEGLELDWDGLTGENPDVVIGNAVSALPLLAADKGMGKAIEASPATGAAPADAAPTNSPGSDFWRNNGTAMLWGIGLLLAGGVFAWWVFRTRPPKCAAYVVPDTVPDDLALPPYEPPTAPIAVRPDPPTEPVPVPKPEAPPKQEAETPAEPEEPREPVVAPKPEVPAKQDAEEPAAPDVPAEPDPEPDTATEPTPDKPAPSEEDVAPSDQKDKE